MSLDLDKLFLQGKLSEDEYCILAIDNSQVVAVAIDNIDRITTVSLSITPTGTYLGEVLYSPEITKSDEKFLAKESNFQIARKNFLDKIKRLEYNGRHNFEITWFQK